MNQFYDNQEFLTRMGLSPDKQCKADMEKELQENPPANSGFHEMLPSDQSFRDFIRTRLPRKKASPALLQSIKSKIYNTKPGSR
ncbi:MAG: hypothetical protein RI973_1066 [Bacteroidota bacterium]|jgi:hypothetical protein